MQNQRRQLQGYLQQMMIKFILTKYNTNQKTIIFENSIDEN